MTTTAEPNPRVIDVLAHAEVVAAVDALIDAQRRVRRAERTPLNYESDPGGYPARKQAQSVQIYRARDDHRAAWERLTRAMNRRIEDLVREETKP